MKLINLERENNEKSFFILLSTTIAFTAFVQEKYFDRNQLPQLDQEIIDSSDYSYEKITVNVKVEAINIGNRPEFYYWGNPSQLSQYDIYGKTYSIGFSYNL